MNPNQTPTLGGMVPDPKVLKVMKAIRQIESSGNYEAVGDNGTSAGAFQWNNGKERLTPGQIPKNFLAHAKEAGVDVKDFSKASQNQVAYSIMKKWKDVDGLDPEEIAAKWNGAKRDANGKLTYIAPEYGEKFRQALFANQANPNQMVSSQAAPIGATQFQTTVPRETPEQGGILSQLGTGKIEPPKEPSKLDYRLGQGSEALGKLSEGVAELSFPKTASGLLQTGGAVAGGALDLVDTALNAATFGGYDATMDFVGKKLLAPIFNASGGETFIKHWQQFATENPETAKNIGAAVNIASAVPVLRVVKQGLGAAKGVAGAAVAKTGFTKTVEEAAKAELRQSAASAPSKAKDLLSTRILKGKPVDPVDTIVDKNYLPDVVEDANGIPRYQASTAIRRLDDEMEMDEQMLQNALEQASQKGLIGYVPMTALRAEADAIIKRAFVDRGQVDAALKKASKIFDDYTKYKGDLVPLTELNNMKRGIREAVNFNSPKMGADVRYHLGQMFMETIEDVAEKNGVKEISRINREIAEKIRAKEALEFLNERSVVERPGFRSMLGRKSGDVGTIAGEAVGQAVGVPAVGGMIGRGISNRAISGSGKSVVGKLKTKRGRKRPSKALVGAALAPSLLSSTQEGLQEEPR